MWFSCFFFIYFFARSLARSLEILVALCRRCSVSVLSFILYYLREVGWLVGALRDRIGSGVLTACEVCRIALSVSVSVSVSDILYYTVVVVVNTVRCTAAS